MSSNLAGYTTHKCNQTSEFHYTMYMVNSYSKRKCRFIVIGILVTLFLILNVIQLPRGPYFDCSYDRSGHRVQYGFPFIFVQRSVPTTNCTTPLNATLDEIGNYSTHHILPAAFLGNLVLCGILGFVVIKIMEKSALGPKK